MKMKQLLALLLCLMLVFSLAACGGEPDEAADPDQTSQTGQTGQVRIGLMLGELQFLAKCPGVMMNGAVRPGDRHVRRHHDGIAAADIDLNAVYLRRAGDRQPCIGRHNGQSRRDDQRHHGYDQLGHGFFHSFVSSRV